MPLPVESVNGSLQRLRSEQAADHLGTGWMTSHIGRVGANAPRYTQEESSTVGAGSELRESRELMCSATEEILRYSSVTMHSGEQPREGIKHPPVKVRLD